jgi:hypothetical protein
MSALATRIVAALEADTAVVALAGSRCFDRDIRQAGPGSVTNVWDANGFLLGPTIGVDDQGGTRNPFAPPGAYDDRLAVWLMADGTPEGRAALDALTGRVIVLLSTWQDPVTRATLTYASRLGQRDDPPPDTGVIDQIIFRVGGMFIY